jgi:hypothetical protein
MLALAYKAESKPALKQALKQNSIKMEIIIITPLMLALNNKLAQCQNVTDSVLGRQRSTNPALVPLLGFKRAERPNYLLVIMNLPPEPNHQNDPDEAVLAWDRPVPPPEYEPHGAPDWENPMSWRPSAGVHPIWYDLHAP